MFSVLKATDEAILQSEFDELRLIPENIFYPTSASIETPVGVFGKCLRQAYYEKVFPDKAEKFSTKALRIFDFGNIFEEHEIELYKRLGIFVADHVKLGFKILENENGSYFVSGEADVIVKDPETNKLIGIELKTGYGENFIRQHITGYSKRYSKPLKYLATLDGVAPKIEHILQASLYLHFFKNIRPEFGIDEWHIVYMARDKLVGAEYRLTLEPINGMHKIKIEKIYDSSHGEINQPIPILDMYVEWILDRFRKLATHIGQRILPPRDYQPIANDPSLVKAYAAEGIISKSRAEWLKTHPNEALDWQCEYCPFREICLKDK